MAKNLLNNTIKKIDFDGIDIDKYVDRDINEDIKNFSIDNTAVDKIHIPDDIKKSAKHPFKEIKKEKRKNIRYIILDILIVSIILLPVAGIANPKVFEKIPTVYPVFEKINRFIEIDNLKYLMGISNEKEVVEGSADSSINTVYIKEKDIKKPKTNNEAIKLIHSLANTLVEADYKWQCGEITPKTIKLALEGVENIRDDYDRMHLRNSLRKWEKGDFSNAVEVHNYVWEMLDGNVGKAENLDNKQINKIIKKYY